MQKAQQPLMTPQIMFQCPHCYVKLNVPISFSGQTAPCPICKNPIQTPAALMMVTPTATTAEVTPPPAPKKKWANPTVGLESSSFVGATAAAQAAQPSRRSEKRGVMPDNAVHQGDLDKKETRRLVKMLALVLVTIILISLGFVFMNSNVSGSKLSPSDWLKNRMPKLHE